MTEYDFGHTNLASQRLKYLANIFSRATNPFIQDALTTSPELMLDLGCGPGDTTHTLGALTDAHRVIGLDISDHFIALATQTQTRKVTFQQHDLTGVPFPTGPADVAYSRFVLTHLNNPAPNIARWISQLRPQGLLLIEEVEWIHTSQETFRLYLDIVVRMLAAQKNQLYLGPSLHKLPDTMLYRKHTSQIRHLAVYNYQAATMFHMNIQTWKNRPFIQANYEPGLIEDLEEALKHIAQNEKNGSQIEWGMRQVIFQALSTDFKK